MFWWGFCYQAVSSSQAVERETALQTAFFRSTSALGPPLSGPAHLCHRFPAHPLASWPISSSRSSSLPVSLAPMSSFSYIAPSPTFQSSLLTTSCLVSRLHLNNDLQHEVVAPVRTRNQVLSRNILETICSFADDCFKCPPRREIERNCWMNISRDIIETATAAGIYALRLLQTVRCGRLGPRAARSA